MSTKLKLRYYGDPVLRKVTKPVKSVGPGERMLVREMIRAMYEFDGAGLAAPQVGISEQIFVADAGEGPFVVINPEIIPLSAKSTVMQEGCLSLPGIHIGVKRPEKIRVRYLNEFGQPIEREFDGLMAKIFQHESDHLFARLLVDYATSEELTKYRDQLETLKARSCPSASIKG